MTLAKSALLCALGKFFNFCFESMIITQHLLNEYNVVLDTYSSTNISWHISPHKDIITGTDKTYVILNGDLLGQTIEVNVLIKGI